MYLDKLSINSDITKLLQTTTHYTFTIKKDMNFEETQNKITNTDFNILDTIASLNANNTKPSNTLDFSNKYTKMLFFGTCIISGILLMYLILQE